MIIRSVKGESGFTSKQRKKVIYGREKHRKGEIIEKDNRKVKGRKQVNRKRRDCAATLSDIYPSTCLAWVALTGVSRSLTYTILPPRKGDRTRGVRSVKFIMI